MWLRSLFKWELKRFAILIFGGMFVPATNKKINLNEADNHRHLSIFSLTVDERKDLNLLFFKIQ